MWATTYRQDNDTPALNALKALRGAPISMGRGEIPVELCQQPSVLPISFYTNVSERGLLYEYSNKSEPDRPVVRQYEIGGVRYIVKATVKDGAKETAVKKIRRLLQNDLNKAAT